MFKFLALTFLINLGFSTNRISPSCDQICGKWMSSEQNLMVEVYKNGDQFKAKVLWFKCDSGYPVGECCDKNNPDPALRNRKILGMEVLNGLKFDSENRTWEKVLSMTQTRVKNGMLQLL